MPFVFKPGRRTFEIRSSLLIFLTLLVTIVIFLLKPIPQSLAYHLFADKRSIAGIPNFFNVVTNIPFLIIGAIGIFQLKRAADLLFRVLYGTLFLGILLTGLGSAVYHTMPDNHTLVYDRVPMTLVFMSLLSATLSERVDRRVGKHLFPLLILLGVASVLWWKYTEARGAGDLRLYVLIQYYPMLLIPLLLLLYPSKTYNRGVPALVWAVFWYIAAKLCDRYDTEIYQVTGFISGHSVKHLFSEVSAWYLVVVFRRNHEISAF